MITIFFILLFTLFSQTTFAIPNCGPNDVFSNPGVGNGCCYTGKMYQSGQLHEALTFACVDGQWLYSGHLGDSNPVSWAQDTQMCKSYGPYSSSSTGYFGPYAIDKKIFTTRDKYLMYGSATNMYCGDNKYCDNFQNCVACGGSNNPCTAQSQSQKTVFGFYFYWYDTGTNDNAYKICGPTYGTPYGYQACDTSLKSVCSQLSTLEQTPIFGENSYIKWNNKDMYKADFIRLKRSGIDVAVLVGDPRENFDTQALPIINKSLQELTAEGKDTPKLVLFEALDNWLDVNKPEIVQSLHNQDTRNQLVTKIVNRVKNVWDGLDDKYEYLYNNQKVLWLFRPPEKYNTKLNCQFASEIKEKLKSAGYDTFLVAPSNFGNCEAIGAYHNWGQGAAILPDQTKAQAPVKFISPKIDVCEVTPGLERNNATLCAGNYTIFSTFPKLTRDNGDLFKQSWDYCQNHNEGWIVVQTWNEYFESTNIAPSVRNSTPNQSDPYFMVKINRDKVNMFKNEYKPWIECEIDAECYINGIQKQCKNNICVMPSKTGDYNNDTKVDLTDFAYWKSQYLQNKMTLIDFSVWKTAYLLN